MTSRQRTLVAAWLSVGLCLAAAAVFITRASVSTTFHYDESMQYWMARGVDAFAPPLQPPGGIRDVLYQNGRGNLDPGGFTLLLHVWLQIARSTAWQRLFPELFFLAAMGGLSWLGWRWTRSVPFACLAASIPAIFPVLIDRANEVRAYSMEFAGIVIACAILEILWSRPTVWKCFAGGAIMGLFLTSRYSFLFITLGVSILLVYRFRPWRGPMSRVARLSAFLIPIGISGVAVIVFGFIPEYHSRIAYEGGRMVAYLQEHKLPTSMDAEAVRRILANLFIPSALPLTLGPALLLALRAHVPQSRGRELTPVVVLPWIVLILTAALWKWHPWRMGTQWSSYLSGLSAVMVVLILAEIWWLAACGNEPCSRLVQVRSLVMGIAVVMLALCLGTYERKLAYNVVPALNYLTKTKLWRGAVAVDTHSFPQVRYLYEEGSFRRKKHYPKVFRLPHWNGPQPLIGDRTSFLITHYRWERLPDIYPGVIFVRDESLPPHLYRVAAPAP